MQTWASVEHGYWYARSTEFMQTGVMQNLRWLRVPGDTLFAAGIVALVLFIARLSMSGTARPRRNEVEQPDTQGSAAE